MRFTNLFIVCRVNGCWRSGDFIFLNVTVLFIFKISNIFFFFFLMVYVNTTRTHEKFVAVPIHKTYKEISINKMKWCHHTCMPACRSLLNLLFRVGKKKVASITWECVWWLCHRLLVPHDFYNGSEVPYGVASMFKLFYYKSITKLRIISQITWSTKHWSRNTIFPIPNGIPFPFSWSLVGDIFACCFGFGP